MYDKIKLQEILLQSEFRTLDSLGHPYPPSANVYKQIQKKMNDSGSVISAKHIYVIVRENRNGYRDQIEKAFSIQTNDHGPIDCDSTSSSVNTTVDSVTHTKHFDLFVSAEKWNEVKPIHKVYNGRSYKVLQIGWTDILAENFWVQQKLSCVISFKKHTICSNLSAKYFISIIGKCTVCGADIQCTLLKEPVQGADIKFDCRVQNIISEAHVTTKTTRQLKGKLRACMTDRMIVQGKDAITVCREEAARLKVFGDINPPILPSTAVLRKAKERKLLQQYGLVFATPALNLVHNSQYGKYAGSVRSVAMMDFHCMYWTSEQELIYKARYRAPDAFMAIDATGGIVSRESSQDPRVFLYQCMVADRDGSTPVFQMLSADQRALHIAYFLRKIVAVVKAPHTVVCDFGLAILIAVAEVFARCVDLSDYLNKCYNIAVLDMPISTPECYILLDVSHLVAMVARAKALKGRDKLLVRRFYLRCISQAYQMASFRKLEHFLESVLVVALSNYIGLSANGEQLRSEKCMQFLNTTIRGVAVEEPHTDIDEDTSHDVDVPEESNQEDNENDHLDSDWVQWSRSLYTRADEVAADSNDGTTINACYNPDFAEYIRKHLLPYLPLWTRAMQPYFKRGSSVATSSCVEAEFSDLKNRGFKGQLPMRTDKFVARHLDYLDGKIKLSSKPADIKKVPHISERDSSEKDMDSQSREVTKLFDNSNKTDDFIDCEIQSMNEKTGARLTENPNLSSDSEIQNHSSLTIIKPTDDITDDSIVSFPSGTKTLEYSKVFDDYSITSPLSNPEQNASDWSICENWRGQIGKQCQKKKIDGTHVTPPLKKRTKPSYLDKCPEWDFIKDMRTASIPLISNGGTTKPDGRTTITLHETCAFDSILQLVVSGIAMHHSYEHALELTENLTISLARSMLQVGKVLSKHYAMRAEILMNLGMFENAIETYLRGVKRLNTNCNVAHLAEYLFPSVPSCEKSGSCLCGTKERRKIILLNIDLHILLNEGLDHMQQAIDSAIVTSRTCRKCKHSVQDTIYYGPHLMIDTAIFTDFSYTNRNTQLKHTLDSIAKKIDLGGKKYVLGGVVHYVPGGSGHYIAYAYGGNYWYEYNDVCKKRMTVTSKTIVAPHLLFYIIKE